MTERKDLEEDQEKILTLQEAAKLTKVSRQAIFLAIQKGKLKAERKGRRWMVLLQDLIKYQEYKFCRDISYYNGAPLFDDDLREMSPMKVAKLLGKDLQHIYYLIRIGELPAMKKGGSWVIREEAARKIYEKRCQKYQENYKLA